jgi:glycosyltransferase involved in cell wall biosynthesis
MGGDDDKIPFERKEELRREICGELHINQDDFIIITGGKIDQTKNIHLLMQAVNELDNKKIKLIVFGQPNDMMSPKIEGLARNKNICFIGWIPADKAYEYFLISDLGFFPGTHSVLWEQACACGLPCVFKNWEGMHHVDMGGNCEFLNEDSVATIKDIIADIYFEKEKIAKMKLAAEECKSNFFYSEIAKRAIEKRGDE